MKIRNSVIAVTHSEAFAAEADVVVRLEKKKLAGLNMRGRESFYELDQKSISQYFLS